MRSSILTALCVLSSHLAVLPPTCVAQQSSSIQVTVVSAHGSPIPAAEVRIIGLPDLIGLPAPNGKFLFKNVAPGTYQIFVRYPGFRDETVSDVVVVDGKTTELKVTLKEGPPRASDYRIYQSLDDVHSYTKTLAGIGQPPVCSAPVPEGKEWYRFMFVPTFGPPAFVRVDVESEETATLLTYIWSGQGGYDWGKSVKNIRKLTSEEQASLFETMADIGFWTLPSKFEHPPDMVLVDGTEWFIEGVKDGRCHVVMRHSSPLTELFASQFLAGVAKLKPYYKADP